MRKVKIKAGSNSLVREGGEINHAAFAYVGQQATHIVERGGRTAISTSGFAAAGRGLDEAAYMTGGRLVMDAWHEQLGEQAGSLYLLSSLVLSAEMVAAMQHEQDAGRIPLINGEWGNPEVGNNDQVALAVAKALGLQHLVLLGDKRGVLRDMHDDESVLSQADIGDAETYDYGTSLSGTGGMSEKFAVARQAALSGISCHYGHWGSDIGDLIGGTVGTTFVSNLEMSR